MDRPASHEPVALLPPREHDDEPKADDRDIESDAGRPEPPPDKNLDHEYSVANTVKFTWLGTYFFFSLLLTLYNKLVLGMVRVLCLVACAALLTLPSLPFPGCSHASTPPLPAWAPLPCCSSATSS